MVYSPEFVRAVKKCLPDHTELDQALAWGHSARVVEIMNDVLHWYLVVESACEAILEDDHVQGNQPFTRELQSEKRNVQHRIKRLTKLLVAFQEFEPVHPVCNCHPNTTVH